MIAPVTDPNQYSFGTSLNPRAAFMGNSLVWNDQFGDAAIYTFVPDVAGSPPPTNFSFPTKTTPNDRKISVAPCTTSPYFRAALGGTPLYRCTSDGPWYEGGQVVYAGSSSLELYGLGPNDLAFVNTDSSKNIFAVLSMQDGQLHPTADLLVWRWGS